MNCISCIAPCLIRTHCSSKWLAHIDQFRFRTRFKKNQQIIFEGSPVLGVYFVGKGKVKVFSSGMNGKQQIVRFANEGHLIGHKGFNKDVYTINAVAMEDAHLCFIENEFMDEVFRYNPDFTFALMMFYSRELRKMENRLKNIAQLNTRERMAETLLLLLENFGLNEQNELNVSFTREDLSCTSGSTVQQVAMQLTDFENEEIIERQGKKIRILDTDGLKAIISKHNQYAIFE